MIPSNHTCYRILTFGDFCEIFLSSDRWHAWSSIVDWAPWRDDVQQYLLRRVLLFVPTMVLASVFVFGVMHVLPGDVALAILGAEDESFRQEDVDILREALGLNDPVPVRYGKWAWSMLSGGFGGRSLNDNEPIGEIIARRFPVTLQLALLTFAITMVVSLPLGVLAALQQDKPVDYVIRSVSILGLAMPNFWVALLVIMGLVLVFLWGPPVIFRHVWVEPATAFQKLIFPALVLSWGSSSFIIRVTRATMLEVLRQDYIRTARSKGLGQRLVVTRHALRNALIPVVTLLGGHLDAQIAGTVILENVFGLPGVGQGIIDAATTRDYPVMVTLAMVLVVITLVTNLVIDIVYVFLNPRISYD